MAVSWVHVPCITGHLTPRGHNIASANVKTELMEHRGGESLREDIGEL